MTPSKQPESFFKVFIWAFGLTVPIALAVGSLWFNWSTRQSAFDPVYQRLAEKLPLKNYTNPEEAKKEHYFVGIREDRSSGNNFALDLIHHSADLQYIYPGYPQNMYEDRDLWSKYFSREFNPASWIYQFKQMGGVGVQVIHSWTGCFDIIDKYGADLVIIGNSELYYDLSPDFLAKLLRDSGVPSLKNLRVLNCATSYMLLDMVELTAKELKSRLKKKAKWVVWGFSYWSTYLNSPEFARMRENRNKVFAEYKSSTETGPSNSFILPKLDSKLTWDTVFSPTIDKYQVARERYLGIGTPRPLEEGGYIPTASLQSPTSLEHAVSQIKPFYRALSNSTEADCNLDKAKPALTRAISAIDRISEKTLIYIPPTTPLHHLAGPACLAENVKTELETRRTQDRIISTLGMEEFGLNYKHYLFPTENKDLLRLDVNHTNSSGAERVTRKIADMIIEKERTP